MRVIDEPLDPSRRADFCNRPYIAPVHPEHLDDFGMVAQRKASLYVIDRSWAELKIFSFQYGHHGLVQRIREHPETGGNFSV
jgi:hypothetical protein